MTLQCSACYETASSDSSLGAAKTFAWISMVVSVLLTIAVIVCVVMLEFSLTTPLIDRVLQWLIVSLGLYL